MLRVLVLLPLTLIACSPDRPATTAFTDVDPSADPQQTQDRPGTQWSDLKAAAPKASTSSSAWLEPSPSSFSFTADDSAWKTFTVRTSSDVDSVLVVVNPTGKDRALEVAGGNRPPSRDYCPAEGNDSPTRARRNGWSLHLSACAAGETEIVLFDHEQTELARYAIQVAEAKAEAEAEAGTGSSAWLEPSPASFSFTADDSAWKTFTVRTSSDVDSVLVVVNPTGKDRALEVAGGNRPPSRDYCPAEGNDSPTRARRNGWSLYLSVCAAGETEIVLFDYEQTELARYDVRVQEPSGESPRFNIELVFADNIPSEDRDIFRRAAQEWERVILDDLPDVVLERTFHETSPTIAKGREVDDLLVVVHQKEPRSSLAPVFGIEAFAQMFLARPGGLSVLGQVTYGEDSRRILTEIHEERSEFYAKGNRINGYPPYAPVDELVEQEMHTMALHEIGHVLGVGTLDQWFDYIKPAEYWENPLPYNIIGNPFPIQFFYLSDTYAWEGFLRLRRVFEADLGPDSGAFLYYGEAIPLDDERHHWGRMFEANLDVMSTIGVLAPNGTLLPPYISPLTRGALADLGYEVEMSTPIYDVGLDRLRILPEPAAAKPTLSRPTLICRVGH